MATPELSRKVRQLDHDVRAIYEMLTSISHTQIGHGSRLDELSAKVNSIAGTQLRHGNRLDELTDKLDDHDARFDAHDKRFDTMDGKLDEILTLVRGKDAS